MKLKKEYVKYVIIGILALALLLSCTVGGRHYTDPATYSHTIEVLDGQRITILGLSAASAAASAALSSLPTDTCTPLAQELAELSSYFLFVLAVVYLEKFLLTILGAVTCYGLIPVGCALLLVHCFFENRTLKSLGARLIAFGLALILVIPASVWVTDQVNAIYDQSIEMTVASANTASGSLLENKDAEEGEEGPVIDQAMSLMDSVSVSVSKVITQFKYVLNRFLDALAVIIVTNCAIPILVILFFLWLIRQLFGIQLPTPKPPRIGKPTQHTDPGGKGKLVEADFIDISEENISTEPEGQLTTL